MAAEAYSSSNSYPNDYANNTPFSDEDILTAGQLNFIAANLNSIIKLLTWNEELTKTGNKSTPASSAQIIDLT